MGTTTASASASASVQIKPADSRCKYWSKIIRAGSSLPLPSASGGASDIAAPYLRNGDDEIFPGDILIEGEANHHRHARGWSYWVTYCDSNGALHRIKNPGTAEKMALKTAGLPAEYLPGSGQLAACVRYAHGVRLGMIEAPAL